MDDVVDAAGCGADEEVFDEDWTVLGGGLLIEWRVSRVKELYCTFCYPSCSCGIVSSLDSGNLQKLN